MEEVWFYAYRYLDKFVFKRPKGFGGNNKAKAMAQSESNSAHLPATGTKNKKPLIVMMKGFQKKGDDILSHKMQYHLRRRA